MKKIKVKAHGIRVHVAPTVTVYMLKEGCLRFGKGKPLSVICTFFDIVTELVPSDFSKAEVVVVTRRIKREKTAEKAV